MNEVLEAHRRAVAALPDHPMLGAAKKAFAKLDCPAQAGWTVKIDEGAHIISRCGGGKGSHTLQLEPVIKVIENLGYSRSIFETWVHQEKSNWVFKPLNDFIKHYTETTKEEIAIPEEYKAACQAYEAQKAKVLDVDKLKAALVQGTAWGLDETDETFKKARALLITKKAQGDELTCGDCTS